MLTEKQLHKLRQHLEKERDRLEQHIDELMDLLRLEDRDVGSGEDDADIAARVVAYDGLMMLLGSEQQSLEDVRRALRAMDKGTYGLCENCGQEISPARLQARPHARLCFSCQEKEGD